MLSSSSSSHNKIVSHIDTPGSPAILPATRQTCVAPALADGILENCNNWQDPQNCAADYSSTSTI